MSMTTNFHLNGHYSGDDRRMPLVQHDYYDDKRSPSGVPYHALTIAHGNEQVVMFLTTEQFRALFNVLADKVTVFELRQQLQGFRFPDKGDDDDER